MKFYIKKMIIIEKFINKNPNNLKNIHNKIKKFHYEENSISILALIYLIRYYKNENACYKKIKTNIKTCILLATKFLLDKEICNTTEYELDVIEKIGWNLFVSVDEYNYYSSVISSSMTDVKP